MLKHMQSFQKMLGKCAKELIESHGPKSRTGCIKATYKGSNLFARATPGCREINDHQTLGRARL